jgi:hypothetical protein
MFFQIYLHAQENNKVVILSNRVGYSIDQVESNYFRLFERFPDFKKAVIYLTPANQYFIKITTGKTDSLEQDTIIAYSESTILRLAEKIEHFEDLIKGDYRIGDKIPTLVTVDGSQIELKYKVIQSDSISRISSTILQPDTSSVYMIILNDGSELLGTIINEDNKSITFKTVSGLKMEIDKVMIKEINLAKGEIENGRFLREDPNQTRLLFAPTGKSLKAGEGYFSAYELFFTFLAVGVTDFITLSGGVSLLPGAEEQIVYVAPKIRFLQLKNFDLSGGILYSHVSELNFGIAYGVVTYGTQRDGITLGLGWGYANDDFADKPVVMIGGEVQLSNSVKLLTENWIPPKSDVAVISFGLRFFGEHLAADFALITTTKASGNWPFLPWIGFVYNF